MYKPMLDAMGVTYPQYLVLTVRGGGRRLDHRRHRAAPLPGIQHREPPAQRLEQAGLVARRRSQVDERQVQVWLTDAGRAVVAQSACLGDSLIQRSGMTGDEVTELNREVGRLRDALVGDQAR